MTRTKIKEFAVDTLYDIIGSILFAMGIVTFLKNAGFAPGGVSGLALMGNYLWNLPIGITTLLLNIPIALLCYKLVGREFLFKSFRSIAISMVFLDFVFPFFPTYHSDSLLAALFSGLFTGLGMGIIYMRGSSTGGTDFFVVAVRKLRPHWSLGQITLGTDAIIIVVGGLVYGRIDAALYGVVCTYVCSPVMDKLMYGSGSGKMALIITDHGDEIAKSINEVTDRGCTTVPAIGTYSGKHRDMLLCVCSTSQIYKIRRLAHAVDPDAFITITEATEVYGEGFTPPEKH